MEVLKCETSINKYNNEYKRKLENEMTKFNGKISYSEAETASEMTSGTKMTRKSIQSRQEGLSPDLDEAVNFKEGYDGTINDRDGGFNPNPDVEFDDEEDHEE